MEYLYNDLDVDVDYVKDQIEKYGINGAASELGVSTNSYDNLILAGRLLMHYQHMRSVKTVEQYLRIFGHRMQKIYRDFFHKHERVFDKLVSVKTPYNYKTDFFSASTLIRTFLSKPHFDTFPVETVEFMLLRVAVQLYSDEGLNRVVEYYEKLAGQNFINASPTLFNSCWRKNMLSSCFLRKIDDSLESILNDGIAGDGLIGSLGAGIGLDASLIRHSEIATAGMSQGLIKMLKLHDNLVDYVDQRGRRKGAKTIYLRTHHIDLVQYIQSKDMNSGTHETRFINLNIALWASDLFFQRVVNKGKWFLFDPAKTPLLNDTWGEEFVKHYENYEVLAVDMDRRYKELTEKKNKLAEIADSDPQSYFTILTEWLDLAKKRIIYEVYDAEYIMELIVTSLRKTGLPSILSEDACNRKSNQKNLGRISCSNLCTEIVEYTSVDEVASCNLMSLSLPAFVGDNKTFLYGKFGEMIGQAVEALNKVIDVNWYPLDKRDSNDDVIEDGIVSGPNFKHRPMGIGFSGFADAVYMLDYSFTDIHNPNVVSPDISLFNRKVFACAYYNVLLKSCELAANQGPYQSFEGSPLSKGIFQFDMWDDKGGMDPSEWGQTDEVKIGDTIVKPTWASLRHAIMKYGVRNSLLLAMMPTATTGQLLSNTETTEPPQSNLYARTIMNGMYPIMNKHLYKDLKDIGCWTKDVINFIRDKNGNIKGLYDMVPDDKKSERLKYIEHKYKTVWDIKQRILIDLSAERGRYICQSQSFNLFFCNPTDLQIRSALLYGWSVGLKTIIYYLRQKLPDELDAVKNAIVSKRPNDVVVCKREKGCVVCE